MSERAGVEHIVVLTGDNAGTARWISQQVGISEFYGTLLPEDNVTKVKDLQLEYAIKLGRRSTRIIVQNIGITLLIVGGLVTGVFAAGLSMFAAVVGNEAAKC